MSSFSAVIAEKLIDMSYNCVRSNLRVLMATSHKQKYQSKKMKKFLNPAYMTHLNDI